MSTISPTLATATRTGLQTFAIDPDHSEVGFSVRHLLSRTRGRFARFEGAIQLDREHPEASSVRFQVDPASIDTRQPDRDTHLRSGDFFDVANHPAIVFESTVVRPLGDGRFRVDGTLDLRGHRRTVSLDVDYLGVARDPWGNERAGFSTQVVLDRKDYGMTWNAALDNGGFILGDDVTLTIDLEAIAQAATAAA